MSTEDRPIAFRMQLKPGVATEYERRHDELWPDLADALREAGIHDYSIFLDEETMSLFAVLRLRLGINAVPDRMRGLRLGGPGAEHHDGHDRRKDMSLHVAAPAGQIGLVGKREYSSSSTRTACSDSARRTLSLLSL